MQKLHYAVTHPGAIGRGESKQRTSGIRRHRSAGRYAIHAALLVHARQARDTTQEAHLGAFLRDVGFQPSCGTQLGKHRVFAATDRTTFLAQWVGPILARRVRCAIRRELRGDAPLLGTAQIERDAACELLALCRRELGEQRAGPLFQLD